MKIKPKFIRTERSKTVNSPLSSKVEDLIEEYKIPSKFKKVLYIENKNAILKFGSKFKEDKRMKYVYSEKNEVDEEEDFITYYFDGEDYKIYTECNVGGFEQPIYAIVFINKEEKFYSDFFPEKEMRIEKGTYNLIHGSRGYYLSKVKVEEVDIPVLNKNKEKKILSDIDGFFKNKEFYTKNKLVYKRGILLYGAPGNGKCLAKGTKVLMFNGKLKNVENIKIGNILMGDDSKPRKVLSLGSGKEMMYEIQQKNGNNYTVNESHILSLRMNSNAGYFKKNEIIDIPLKTYLKTSNNFKHHAKGFKVGVSFKEKNVMLSPYFLGLWLGDGHSRIPAITTMDKEIVNYLKYFTNKNNMKITVYKQKNNKSNIYDIVSGKKGGRSTVNKIKDILRNYNLLENKHIPIDYKINSRNNRLKLLAGLIDSDGYKNYKNYEITQKSKVLTKDIEFLCRSLGFGCNVFIKIVDGEKYYRISIYGDLENIPIKLPRKKVSPRKINKNPLNTGIEIKKKGIGTYYGFTLDGNHRYLLSDFTVTHNTMLIKHLLTQKKDIYGIIVNCAKGIDIEATKFLDIALKGKPRILVLEDIDGIESYFRSELLNLLDGVETLHNTLVIATTNFLDKIDVGLVNRPSRFDRFYNITPPNDKSRGELLKRFFPTLKVKELEEYIKLTKDFTGAYFKEIFIVKNVQNISIKDAINNIKEQLDFNKECIKESKIFG